MNAILSVEIQLLFQMNNVMMLMTYLLMDVINVSFLALKTVMNVSMDNVWNVILDIR